MKALFDDDGSEYRVLVNLKGQYSLWPIFKAIPQGWSVALDRGHRKACLDWIGKNWTNMKPLGMDQQQHSDNPSIQ